MVTERFDWGNVRRTKRFSVELSSEGFDRGAFLFLSTVSSERLKWRMSSVLVSSM